jgi:dienelactone hydrolase
MIEDMRLEAVRIAVSDSAIAGTFAFPETGMPGILFVHGWTGSQQTDLARSKRIASLGCVCLTFDLRGHADTEAMQLTVTPEENLGDALAAYDMLASQPDVDARSICVIASSYGAYLATILTTLRPVRWLALRVPALYRDAHWTVPKGRLDRLDLKVFRQTRLDEGETRALKAAASFGGDVLVVESEHDHLVPHSTIANYLAAFRQSRSITYRIIDGADHALSDASSQQAYSALLYGWVKEMVVGAR